MGVSISGWPRTTSWSAASWSKVHSQQSLKGVVGFTARIFEGVPWPLTHGTGGGDRFERRFAQGPHTMSMEESSSAHTLQAIPAQGLPILRFGGIGGTALPANPFDFSSTIAQVTPASVVIEVTRRPRLTPPFLEELVQQVMDERKQFGSFLGGAIPKSLASLQQPQEIKQWFVSWLEKWAVESTGKSVGSGGWYALIDGKGIERPMVITNAHVVESEHPKSLLIRGRHWKAHIPLETRYEAILNENRTYDYLQLEPVPRRVEMVFAKTPILGKDARGEHLDIAVLEPQDMAGFYQRTTRTQWGLPDGVSPLVLDDNLQDDLPGQPVLKVGNSSGIGSGNLNVGIIGGYRALRHEDPYGVVCASHPYITLENGISLNPGDSGGPLISGVTGKVLGINQIKLRHQGANGVFESVEGLGLAIAATEVIGQLKAWGFQLPQATPRVAGPESRTRGGKPMFEEALW